MAKPDPSPETYLNLSAPTQFELAQRIDAALQAAENAVTVSQEAQSFQLWLQQFCDLANEEFNSALDAPQIDGQRIKNQLKSGFLVAIEHLIALNQSKGSLAQGTFKLAIALLVERSFLDTLDFMHAQGSWRFDIQRSMQDLCKELQTHLDGICE